MIWEEDMNLMMSLHRPSTPSELDFHARTGMRSFHLSAGGPREAEVHPSLLWLRSLRSGRPRGREGHRSGVRAGGRPARAGAGAV